MKLTKIQSHNPHFIDLKRINNESVIVDAGAFLGTFEEEMRTLLRHQNCRIIVLEADRDQRQLLEDKRLHNVAIVGKALVGQNSPSERLFHQYIGFPGWGSFFSLNLRKGLAAKKCKGIISYMIGTIKINDIFSEFGIGKIDYFKIDIMGAEKEVVETMSQETAARINQIDVKFYELQSGMDAEEGKKKLRDLGFGTERTIDMEVNITHVSKRQVYGWRYNE